MTARRLILVRHAKSLQDGGPDLGRALSHRGERQAPLLGRRLAQEGVPDRVLVSPARRAQRTWELARPALPEAPEPEVEDRIYDNTVEDLVAVVNDAPSNVTTLVLVGHNPSMEQFVLTVHDAAGEPDAPVREFPTSALAGFGTDAAWADVSLGDLRLEWVWSPSG